MNNLIGIKELADHLGVSVKTLRVRVSKGKIAQPVQRFGDELFWNRVDFFPTQILGRSQPHPADFEIGIQHEGGLRRGEMHVIQAKSRKDKSEYLHGTDAQTLEYNPNRSFVFDEDVKHAYLTPIKPLPLDEGKA